MNDMNATTDQTDQTTPPATGTIENRVARAGVLAPPLTERPEGGPRRVGVEIECIALTAADAAALVREAFGGTIRVDDPYRYVLEGARHGDFVVELDTKYAHPSGRWDEVEVESEWLAGLVDLMREVDQEASALIGTLSEDFVPLEIVGPPIPWSDLAELDPLFHSIRDAGATGTDEGALYALGLHLNPEVASLEADWIADVLKAYVLMSAWLRRSIDVDITRRLLPYIDPFPKRYAKRILQPGYRPDMTGLIEDYLADNATRNRELDMLPLFAHLDPARVRRAVKDDRVNARPAFHYRLPDTRFTDTAGGPVAEWNRWVLVERLAAAPELLRRMADDFLAHYDGLVPGEWGSRDWAAKSDSYVRALVG